MNQRTRFIRMALLTTTVAVVVAGCSTFRAGPGRVQDTFGYKGLVDGYASANDLRPYDGDILQADLWSDSQQSGELLNLDLWPLVGIGIGAFGARVHVGSLGAGLGFVFYHPTSARDADRIIIVD